jgi:flavin reductase (DIM6/NTAB) family NADH-FMN oxidoreductase RutF
VKKESIDLHVMWHIDVLLQAYPVTLVTTVNKKGILDAAPYSLVLPYCSSPKNPQMLLIVNKSWHTAKNIVETGEFVLNYPGTGQVKDIVETSRYYEAGVNEIEYTDFTTMPSNHVNPPRITECYQHVECRVIRTEKPSNLQLNFIAEVLDISQDQGLYDLGRVERAKKVNAPAYLGVDEEQHHVFGEIKNICAEEIDLFFKE